TLLAMPTAWMPPCRNASPPMAGSAKNPSWLTECPRAGTARQHSRLPNTTSAWRSSSPTRANGTAGSATFMRLTSPVRIILAAIRTFPPLCQLPAARLAQMRPHTRAAAVLGRVAGDRLERRRVLQGFQLDRIFSPPIRMLVRCARDVELVAHAEGVLQPHHQQLRRRPGEIGQDRRKTGPLDVTFDVLPGG